ncbi:MAG: hypothetical protein GY805_28710 [Chloroflexi bacterium]|nr:hypothetical protein [Chloroflexota bacterium]
MRKVILFVAILFLMVAFSACASSIETQAESCYVKLSEMPLKGLDFTDMQVEDVKDRPFPGSLDGQAMVLNEGTMLLSRYESSEKAAELMDSDNVLKSFGEGAELVIDAPAVSGDGTAWVRRTDDFGVEIDAAVVRYGDYLLLADPYDSSFAVEGMLDTFSSVLLEYIDDHPECAYMHTETR